MVVNFVLEISGPTPLYSFLATKMKNHNNIDCRRRFVINIVKKKKNEPGYFGVIHVLYRGVRKRNTQPRCIYRNQTNSTNDDENYEEGIRRVTA